MINDVDDNDNEEEEEDDEEEDEDGTEEEDKKLAAQTITAIQWLCMRGRLTNEEKRLLTTDIIFRVSSGEYSQVEVAFSLLVGDGRPSEGSVSLPSDLSLVEEDDMKEFEDVCHSYARKFLAKTK